jgi:hypothetical protein
MTDTIRDLLISLSSHMAYMQGQLEARHELDDFEDFYWYRESVLLRQKVTDALADEPAVPEGRGPVAVDLRYFLAIYVHAHQTGNSVPPHIDAEARAALAQPEPQEQVLARVEFAERKFNCPSDVVLRQYCDDWFYGNPERSEVDPVDLCRGAIKLFAQIPAPIPVSERPWEREGWCDPVGKCWWWNPATNTLGTPWWSYEPWEWMEDAAYSLPYWALPVPQQQP